MPEFLAHRNHKIINLYYFKPLILGYFVVQQEITNEVGAVSGYKYLHSLAPFLLLQSSNA